MESTPTEKEQNTIIESVIEFIETGGFGVVGETLFAFRAPDRKEKDDNLWVVLPTGGSKRHTNVTGEDVKRYNFVVRYCSKNTYDLNRKLFNLDKYITSAKCYNLKDFATIGIEVLRSNDTPYLDTEERWVGEIELRATVYNILAEYPQDESDSEGYYGGVSTGDPEEPTSSEDTTFSDTAQES